MITPFIISTCTVNIVISGVRAMGDVNGVYGRLYLLLKSITGIQGVSAYSGHF